MSSVSSLGVGSNLDLSGLLDKLAAAESAPLVALQKQQTSYTAKLSAYGTLKNALSNFQAAATKLADATLYRGVKVASSAVDVLTATSEATGASGNYSIEVTKLAQAQSLATTGLVDAKAAVGAGRVTIYFGTLSGGAFTDDPTRAAQSAAQSLVISSPTSLEGLRDAINNNATIGVTASIVNDGGASPYRLVLNSTQTGAASSMRIAVTDTAVPAANPPGTALVGLQGLLNHNGATGLQQTSAASNAALKVNGIDITSSTNTVKDAVQGVTMTLAKTGLSTLTVSRDTTSVESAVSAFVTAYNSLQSTATQLTRYDVAKKSGAALVGDSTLRTIQTSIRSALNTPQAGELQVLSKVGVTFQKDGTLAFDATKMKAAFSENREAVVELFSGTGGNTGMGKQVAALIDTFTSSTGKLSNATAGVSATLKTLDTRYASTEVSVEAKVARYRAQFTQLDMIMSKMNATTSYLTSQFNAMSPSK
jgi:flagellar hook-associated protein 2